MTATEILQQAKDEVARKEGYTSWDWIIAEYPCNTKSDKSTDQMLEEASLLAMERIAQQIWIAAEKRGRYLQQRDDNDDETYVPTIGRQPDFGTTMNNLFQ